MAVPAVPAGYDEFGPDNEVEDHPAGIHDDKPHPNHGKDKLKKWFRSLGKRRRDEEEERSQ